MARPSLQNGFEFSCLGIVLDQNHIFTRASCIQDDGSSVGNKISIIPILYNNSFYILCISFWKVYSSKASENVIIEDPLAQKRIDGTYSRGLKFFGKNLFILIYVWFKNLCYKIKDLKKAWKSRSFIRKHRTILRKISKIFISTIYSSSRLTNPCG